MDKQKEHEGIVAGLLEVREKLEKIPQSAELQALETRMGDLAIESKAQHDEVKRANDAAEASLKRADELEARMSQMNFNGEGSGSVAKPTGHMLAYVDYLRTNGKGAVCQKFEQDAEYRALQESAGADGGFLVPDVIEQEIGKNITEMSPFRQFARVSTTTSDGITLRKRLTIPTAKWLDETGTADASSLTYGKLKIQVNPLGAKVPVTSDMLADVPMIQSELNQDAAEAIALAEGTAFMTGDGVNKPLGINSDADYSSVTSVATGAISADDFFNLKVALKDGYMGNAKYLMNRETENDARKLKDSNNNYIWQPDFSASNPATFAGLPYGIMNGLPDPAASVKFLWLGDWSKAYRIVDRSGIAVLQDPFATIWSIDFNFRQRVGGHSYITEAAKVLVGKT